MVKVTQQRKTVPKEVGTYVSKSLKILTEISQNAIVVCTPFITPAEPSAVKDTPPPSLTIPSTFTDIVKTQSELMEV
jgi:hypothetical protein